MSKTKVNRSRMVDILMADPKDFFIILQDDKMIPITSYKRMVVDFDERVEFVNGNRNDLGHPLITYYVELSNESRIALYDLFKDHDYEASLTIHSRSARICVGEDKYLFPVIISVIPHSLPRIFSRTETRAEEITNLRANNRLMPDNIGTIKIEVDSRDLGKMHGFFYEVDESILSRFEIIDI